MSDEKFNLNELVVAAKSKQQKGIVLEKKEETEKKPQSTIPRATSEAIDQRISEQDELIELAKTNPNDPRIVALRKSLLYRETGQLPTLEDIKLATGTGKPQQETVVKPVEPPKPVEEGFVDISDETNDLLVGKPVMKMSEFKKKVDELNKQQESEEVIEKSQEPENEKAPEIVIIEKTVPGELEFSPEEKNKMAKADYIELREVSGLELPTKVTKIERGSVGTLIEKRNKKFTTEMTPFISGYVATIKALNPGDMLDMVFPTGETKVQEEIFRWSKIYKSIQSTSIGKMSFDQFCHNTSALDYNLFLLALLIATYSADKQTIEIICRQKEHGKEGYRFKTDIDYRQLMRVEMLSDKVVDLIVNAAEASKTIEEAKEWHQQAPLLTRKYYQLPSGIIFATQLESVYDSIHNHYEAIEEMVKESQVNGRYALVARYIPKMYVPDEENGGHILLEDIRDIVAYLRTLSPDDMEIISNKAIELVSDLDVKFGLKDVTCPLCGDVTELVEIDLENELFTRASQLRQKKYV